MRQISLSLFCFVKHQKSLQCLFHFKIEGQKLDRRVTNFFENDFRRKEMTFHTIGMALLYYYYFL